MATSLFLAVVLGVATPPARAAEPVALAAIVVEEDRVEFQFSGPVRESVRFEENPPRLLIDLPNVRLTAADRVFEGRGGVLKKVRAGQLSSELVPVARCVVELETYVLYGIQWDGNVMSLALGNAARMPLPPPSLRKDEAPVPAQPAAVKPAAAPVQPAAVKPAAAPAKPAAAPAGAFQVQVGSFSDEVRAKALKTAIEASVSPVTVESVSVSGKTFYQVKAGSFKSRPAAEEAARKLKADGHASAYVVKRK
ncbi:MAG: SPOR domain-containing protein [Elusimicrobia bacterium]|nr:SPOR domain-containing protein [Elusimicrobiota bacterium]